MKEPKPNWITDLTSSPEGTHDKDVDLDVDTTTSLEENSEGCDADRYAVYFTKEELLALAYFFGEYGEMSDTTHTRISRKMVIHCAKYGFYDHEL